MSALRDILEKMYVEDELLNQLDDEQKQILFIKMREEQIRRWNQREAELEEQERNSAPKKKDSRRIQWLKGRDGEVWVWVMGDHPNDPSIDDIIEDEARRKARHLAEAELANDRNITSGAVGPYPPQSLHPSASAREEQLKQELRNMRLGGTSSSSFEESSKASSSDDGFRKPSNTSRDDDYRREEDQKSNGSAPYYAQLRRSPPDGIELEDGRRLYLRPSVEDLENTVREQFNGSPFEKRSELLRQKPSSFDHEPSRGSPTKNGEVRERREKTPKPTSEERRSRTGSGIGSNFVQRFLDEHDPKRRASRDKSPVNSTSPLRNRNDSVSTSKTASPASTPRQNSLETASDLDKKAGSFLVGSFNSRQARSPTKSLREEVLNSPEPQKEPKTKPKQRDEGKDAKPKARRFLDNKSCIPRLRRSSDDNYYASDENTPVRDGGSPKEGVKQEVIAEPARSNGDKLRVNGNVHELAGGAEKKLENGTPPPVPQKPAFLAKKPKASVVENGDGQFVQSIRSYTPGHNPTTTFTPQQVTSPSSGLQKAVAPRPPEEPVLKTTPTKPTREPEGSASSSSSKESSDTVSPEMLRLRQAQQRLEELLPTQDELEKRQSLILEKLMEEHQRLKEEAEKEAERERIAYEEQKRRAREAEAQIRAIAQKAREQHERNIRTSTTLLPMLHKTNSEDLKSQSIRDAVRNMPRPPKPKDRAEIIEWFKKKEQPQGVGLDPWTKRPFVWFHGILSRAEADGLLANQPPGAFIVRISERIWGYTISYVVAGADLKHFLVERIPEGYQFLGTNQVVHKTLQDLVDYHETKPITSKGQECLLYPVGQKDPNNPDYSYLFDQLPMTNGSYNSGSSFSSRFFQSPPSLFVNR